MLPRTNVEPSQRMIFVGLFPQLPRVVPRVIALLAAVLSLLPIASLKAEKPDAVVLPAPALLTKEQLLERVVAMRSAVKDLSVVTNDTVLRGPANMVRN